MECKVKNVSINYEVIGQGKPVLMIHGYTPDHRLMKGCMEPVFKDSCNYKRIYFDLPGMGRTKAESWINNADAMLELVIDFIEEIIPGENYLLASESYGAYLSTGLIKRHSARVDGLLMICPCIVPDANKRKLPQKQVILEDNALISGLDAWDAGKYSSIAVVQSARTWKRYSEEVLPGIKLADDAFLKDFRETGFAFSSISGMVDKSYNKPTLILLGRQDHIVGYKDAWSILDNYPRATFAILDRAGHSLEAEQEAVFNCLVSEWLSRVDEALSNSHKV